MRQIAICALLMIALLSGCAEKKRPAKSSNEKLVPTARELEQLRAFKLDPNTERGQKRIRRIRQQREKIEAARGRMTSWAEEAERRRAD